MAEASTIEGGNTLRIEPTDATVGALVTGVRLAEVGGEDWARIEAAFLDRGVLIFPRQHLSDEEQMGFGRRWGELMIESQPFSNRRPDGGLRGANDPLMRLFRGNEGWHTDSSFQPVSAKASILSARQVPGSGGQTQWADMRAAYEALDEATRERIAGLEAYHSLYHSQGRIGESGDSTAEALAELHAMASPGSDSSPGQSGYRQQLEVPLRPLVKVHPETGRPALYIGRHAYGIPGLDEDESRSLLDRLLAAACQPPRVYSHRWQVGDVVIWDNRRVLHRARPWPADQGRVMHHTRVAGNPVTEAASNIQ